MLTPVIQLYQKAYSGLSKNSWYLSLVMFINRSGTMVVPFMSIYTIQQLHFTIVQSGWVMAFFGIGAISGAFIGGKLTDKIGFYDIQVGALLIGGILFLILGYQHTFISVSIGTFILSICNESFRPANSTAIAHYSNDENKTRSYSLNRLATNLGWAFGGGLGGLLASFNYHLLFWVDGCTNIFAALLLLKLMPRSRIIKTVKAVSSDMISSSAYRDGVYLVFILLSTLFATCFFQFFIMQPVFYKIQWHFNERFIGFLLALNGILIVLIEMVLIHKLEGKRNPLTYITAGIIVAGASFALLNLLPHTVWVALLVVVMITLGEILSMPFMNSFWISRTNNKNRGEYAALYSMSWSAAQIIAPALGSQVIAHGGFNLLWWVLGSVCLFTATGYYFLKKFIHRDKKVAILTD
ncbi:MDR family MFS transporter [Mucilaginibacter sp. SP1R1]|uniref:MDR family MFS transporter n=1 Tax=Mucilaginibacter sp. SP1R1 TaxID=2723091 RepID=UPI00160DF631|nr:MFS transporter [Mucilaginibacter sp. SP1R1]MBB6149407.1 putative MFS family arabinose efflux permease [Mucilaginibacter sp. SP1R1]